MPQTSSFGTSNVFTLIAWPGGTEQAGSYSLRGGSWSDGPWRVRAADRGDNYPGIRNGLIGFRLARD